MEANMLHFLIRARGHLGTGNWLGRWIAEAQQQVRIRAGQVGQTKD